MPAAAAVAPCHSPTGAKRVNELQEEDLDCRSGWRRQAGPCTRLYPTPTHSHRGSCPASPGEPGPSATAETVAAFSGQGSSAQKLPGHTCRLGAARTTSAGRASLAGRGCSRHRRGLRPAGPHHRRCAREGHAGRCAPRRWVLADSDEVEASPQPKDVGRRGEDPPESDLFDPARPGPRRSRSSAAGRPSGTENQHGDQPVT